MVKIVKEWIFPKPKRCNQCPMCGEAKDMNATLPYCKMTHDFPDITTCPLEDNTTYKL